MKLNLKTRLKTRLSRLLGRNKPKLYIITGLGEDISGPDTDEQRHLANQAIDREIAAVVRRQRAQRAAARGRWL